jgi:hypothetical protein
MKVQTPQIASAPATSLDTPEWPGAIAPSPLLPGEDGAEYAKFTPKFLAAAKPRDFIEEILTRDAIDLSWEILRLRHLRAGVLRMACSDGVRSVAGKLGYRPGRLGSLYDFAAEWMAGDSATRNEFQKLLKKAGLGMEDLVAEALSSKIEAFERIDRMVASAEARRNNAYARLIVIAQRSATQCGKRSMKSRMQSFETSKQAK